MLDCKHYNHGRVKIDIVRKKSPNRSKIFISAAAKEKRVFIWSPFSRTFYHWIDSNVTQLAKEFHIKFGKGLFNC